MKSIFGSRPKNLVLEYFNGVKSAKKGIGVAPVRTAIPATVGEIDYIGYSEKENILLVAECKFVRDSPEPQFFRKDIDQFVNSKDAYIKKLRKKVVWIRDNIDTICKALESTGLFKSPIKPKILASVMVTFLPTIAAEFIKDIPCVSLTEFMLAYESAGKYPYNIGTYSIK